MKNNSNPQEDLHIVVSPSEPSSHSSRVGFVLVGAFVVLAIGSYFLVSTHTIGTSKQAASVGLKATQIASVHITASGFSPSSMHITPGTQVTWINDDTSPRQVAANPFPKDNSIPDFNSSIVLLPGDTYSFVFSKAGTYTYHDESRPFDANGTVVVK